MSTVARLLLGPWCVAVLAAGVIVPIGAVVAYGELAARLRKRHGDAEFEGHVREALAVAAADIVPGMVPADGKPLSRAERRALRGIEAASRNEGVRQA